MPRGALLVGLLLATAAAAAPPAPAQRVVSLNPSLTAMLLALDAREVLVGVDDYSLRSQPELVGLPRVGGLADPNLESVAALRPDLVALVPSEEQRDFRSQLRELGLPLLELDPKRFDEVLDAILALGEAVGRRPAAEARVAEIRRARAAVEAAVRGLPRPRAVFVLQREPLFIIGRGSFIDEMLAAAGAQNLGAEVSGHYPRVSLEWLVDVAPEVLLDSSADAEPAAAHWARLPSLPAVRAGRVVALDEGVTTLPGPWLDRALFALARALHGDALPESLR
jgi:ABC-type Fe3+-hydroxamate transport system substrate-binding protein